MGSRRGAEMEQFQPKQTGFHNVVIDLSMLKPYKTVFLAPSDSTVFRGSIVLALTGLS
jgi:hypothetical protein